MSRAGITRGGNSSGAKWNKGGAKSRGGMLSMDFSAFDYLVEQLDNLGANLQEVIGTAMEQAAETVQEDTIEALGKANLPAKGAYSNGDTLNQVVRDAKTVWHGELGEIGLGFDKTALGAGGFLITGTPKMQPDYKLEDIFARKKYKKKIMDQIARELQDEIDTRLGR